MTQGNVEIAKETDKNIEGHKKDEVPIDPSQDSSRKAAHMALGELHSRMPPSDL